MIFCTRSSIFTNISFTNASSYDQLAHHHFRCDEIGKLVMNAPSLLSSPEDVNTHSVIGVFAIA